MSIFFGEPWIAFPTIIGVNIFTEVVYLYIKIVLKVKGNLGFEEWRYLYNWYVSHKLVDYVRGENVICCNFKGYCVFSSNAEVYFVVWIKLNDTLVIIPKQ